MTVKHQISHNHCLIKFYCVCLKCLIKLCESLLEPGAVFFVSIISYCSSISVSISLIICTLHALQAAVFLQTYKTQWSHIEARANFVPNRVLGASPPDISPLESLLPWSVLTTLAQLRFGHCRLLNSCKACITSGISDVCPECGVAPHSVEHLFNW